ncbi:MAG: DUF483 domain-containing protein [Vulcanimicrobiota bacterium]
MALFERIMPERFCREFAEFRGDAHQIVMYMSLVLGIKPLLDDWIPGPRLGKFIDLCASYGLYVRADALHRSVDSRTLPDDIIGREYITSTSAIGFPLNAEVDGNVHVFVSKDKDLLGKGMWYPVIVRNRIIEQPRIDILKYGEVLGYPSCCVRFFRNYNNWSRYNFLREIHSHSAGAPHYHCNPFTKDAVYSYIYHMPCSFRCSETISLVSRLRSEIQKWEPGFVDAIDRHLTIPFLVFYERKFYAFDGFIDDERLYYSQVYFPDSWRPDQVYMKLLQSGNNLHISGGTVHIFSGRREVARIGSEMRENEFEYPFLIQFGKQ